MYKRSLLIMLSLTMIVMFALPAFAGTGKDAAPLFGIGAGIGALVAFGLIVNEQTLNGLRTNFNTIFNQARSAYQPQWTDGAMDIPSSTSMNTYGWMADFPKMREWIGERYFKAIKEESYTLVNKTFEASVRVPRESIEDDQYGIYSPRFTAMGQAAEQLWDDLFFQVLNGGFTGKSYDGKTFFATDHASGGNKASGGGSVLSETSYAAALTAIKSQKDTKGDPLFNGNEPITLWVPPALERTGRLLINADFVSVANGSTQNNVWKGSAKLKVCGKQTSATAWFLTVDFMGLKPFIVQKRRLPDFVAQENPADPSVFNRNEFTYGTSARGNAGYGLHQLSYGSVGA